MVRSGFTARNVASHSSASFSAARAWLLTSQEPELQVPAERGQCPYWICLAPHVTKVDPYWICLAPHVTKVDPGCPGLKVRLCAPAGVDLVGGHGDDARRARVAQQVHRAARAQLHHHMALARVRLAKACAVDCYIVTRCRYTATQKSGVYATWFGSPLLCSTRYEYVMKVSTDLCCSD